MVDGRHENGKCIVPLRRLRISAMEDFMRSPIALVSGATCGDESFPQGMPPMQMTPGKVQVDLAQFLACEQDL